MKELRGELKEVLGADELDVDRYESVLSRMADAHVAMKVQAARFSQEALGVLTEEQRSKVESSGMGMHSRDGKGCQMDQMKKMKEMKQQEMKEST
jgi:Spy/CpxP family protein refolding chaperone